MPTTAYMSAAGVSCNTLGSAAGCGAARLRRSRSEISQVREESGCRYRRGRISPAARLFGARARALGRIATNCSPTIVSTSATGACTASPEAIKLSTASERHSDWERHGRSCSADFDPLVRSKPNRATKTAYGLVSLAFGAKEDPMEDQLMFKAIKSTLPRELLTDYSAARAKAIEWLGERYLLAKPINQRLVPVDEHSAGELTAKILDNFLEVPRSMPTLQVLTRKLLSATRRRSTS